MHNVWRYVAVAAESRWRVFLHSWCDAGLNGYYFFLALAKTVTPAGAPGGSRGGLCRCRPNGPLYQKILAAQKAMPYTDLLGIVAAYCLELEKKRSH